MDLSLDTTPLLGDVGDVGDIGDIGDIGSIGGIGEGSVLLRFTRRMSLIHESRRAIAAARGSTCKKRGIEG